jgi:phosphoribosylformylglycinamidine synthase
VLVRPKDGILDPQGEAVRGGLGQLGYSVTSARVGRVIDIDIDVASADEARAAAEGMCQSLLANPLIEAFEIHVEGDNQA